MAVAARPALPKADRATTERVDTALSAAKTPPCSCAAADNRGNALVAIGTASTAHGSRNSVQA
jgi:hypothetical protein